MSFVRNTSFLAVVLASVCAVSAQDRVGNLQDLVGARGGDGEYQMQQRGYRFLRTDKTGDSAYQYFRESRSDRCVTVHVADGRYQSLVYAPSSDCDRGGSNSGGQAPNQLRDLLGARGSDGEYQMKQRGYHLERVDKSTSGIQQYWSKGRECLQVEMNDGRYESINTTSFRNCAAQSNSGPGNASGSSSVDYPRVQADTDGDGSYTVPGISSRKPDRGYAWLHESRPMIGFSYQNRDKALFYGRITRKIGDREFEMEINDSNLGSATGRGRFRLNPDLNEVEMIDVSGTVRGQRFNGRFNRAWQ